MSMKNACKIFNMDQYIHDYDINIHPTWTNNSLTITKAYATGRNSTYASWIEIDNYTRTFCLPKITIHITKSYDDCRTYLYHLL